VHVCICVLADSSNLCIIRGSNRVYVLYCETWWLGHCFLLAGLPLGWFRTGARVTVVTPPPLAGVGTYVVPAGIGACVAHSFRRLICRI
jgi:hypothetical protein